MSAVAGRAALSIFSRRVAPPGELAGTTGITTFIKTELIADGVGRALVPRPGGARNGLQVGQRVDTAVRRYVQEQKPLHEPGARRVMAALRTHGYAPVAAQVRATWLPLRLTTLVDLVAVDRDGALWAVEIKSTTLATKHHTASYKRECTRTPRLRNQLSHTECNVHMLQAAFGALALERTYADLPGSGVRALVVVATADGAHVYRVPGSYMNLALYSRRTAVPIAVAAASARAEAKKKKKRRAPPAVAPWPTKNARVDAALATLGLRCAAVPRASTKIVRTVERSGRPVGVILCLPARPEKCDPPLATRALSLLTSAAKGLRRRHPTLPTVARLVLAKNSMAVMSVMKPLR